MYIIRMYVCMYYIDKLLNYIKLKYSAMYLLIHVLVCISIPGVVVGLGELKG